MEGAAVNGIERHGEVLREDTEFHAISDPSTETLETQKHENSSSAIAQSVSNCYVFKSRLQEYAQKVKLPTPTYDTIKEGPSHEPSFRSTVIVNDVRYDSLTGFFNRKAAEQSAAEVALKALADSGAMDECISQPVHDMGLCKNLLQEYAQKMNFAIPLYECHKDEKLGLVGHFSCSVDIGGIKYIGGAARSKKEAELKAARTALLAIQSDPNTKLNASSDTYTVVPGKKKVSDSVVKAQKTAPALKPKKCRYKKKPRKFNGDRKKNRQNVNDAVNINSAVEVIPEVIKSDYIVADLGIHTAIEIQENKAEFKGGEQLVKLDLSSVQYSGGDSLSEIHTTDT